jgi:hypothetical protein
LRYHADITAGSLKVPESRVIADLLLRGCDDRTWSEALIQQNLLQARSPATAKRLGQLLRNRLQTMDADLWRLIRDGSLIVATQACLAAAVKHSALLGDFMDTVLREQYRMFNPVLALGLWERYLDGCRSRDSDMPVWSQSTVRRLRSSVFQILAQGGYIDSTRTRKLQAVYISRDLLRYLNEHNEKYVLRVIQVSP